MPTNNVYGPIADMYDTYVKVDFDLDFFRGIATRCSGNVLELMAGTGRVSEALFECNRSLTCLDISREMLSVLMSRFSGGVHTPVVVCADVRSLPLTTSYELVVVPFNSFSELTTVEDQHQALREMSRILSANGKVICTLHNPKVRARSLDGQKKLLGRYGLGGDRELELWVEGTIDQPSGLARSRQRFRIYNERRELASEHIQEVQFALITEATFRDLLRLSGFEVLQLFGDYDASPYDHDTSPYMIWTMQKAGAV